MIHEDDKDIINILEKKIQEIKNVTLVYDSICKKVTRKLFETDEHTLGESC